MNIQLNACDFFQDQKDAFSAELQSIESNQKWIDVSYTNDELPSISDGVHVVYFGTFLSGEKIIWAIQDENYGYEQVDLGSFDDIQSAIEFCDKRKEII
tara:strand:- start:627 stop:923 length:297 start_codon:yes stop_codon:yes gene_type:complete